MSKVCKLCGAEKPLSEFYADRRYRDGHDGRCKACLCAQWAESTAERRRQRGRPRTDRDNKLQRERRKRGGTALREQRTREMRLWRYKQKARQYVRTGVWPFLNPMRPEHEKDWKAALKAVRAEKEKE